MAHLVLAFRAGSLYESANQPGLVHHLRKAVRTDSVSYHGINLIWSNAVRGSNMTTFTSCDVFGVFISVPRDQSTLAHSVFDHVTAQPVYKPWEMEHESAHVLLVGQGTATSDVKAIAVQVTFLSSLGNAAAVK
uniref:Peptidase_M16 domain-containing protein n=1 Tax=Heterorhabditis bacteriophora TaxID=37862 RepID=A0A1I7XUV8_HETBA